MRCAPIDHSLSLGRSQRNSPLLHPSLQTLTCLRFGSFQSLVTCAAAALSVGSVPSERGTDTGVHAAAMGVEWAEDSPAQRAQIQTLYESLKGLRSFAERSTKAAAKYIAVGHKCCDAGDVFAGELLSFTTDSTVLGPALGKLGETMRQVHEHGRAHLAATEQMCLSR